MTEEESYVRFLKFQKRMEAMKEVIRINDPGAYNDLVNRDFFWAPEIRPERYTEWVNANYDIDPDNLVSVQVYSLLMDKPIKEVIKMMKHTNEK